MDTTVRAADQPSPPTPAQLAPALQGLRGRIQAVIRGKDNVIEQVLVALTAGGHVIIEDLPGLGKTTLAYSLARATSCAFNRIQFTSDLMPADIIGVSIYDERQREFVFKQGPLFTNILLADEINRATPKTQSALLEVMDRGKVTVDGQTWALPAPFLVMATQNPVDYESAFPLPASQMDRFLMRLHMGYPDFDHEMEILRSGTLRYDQIETSAALSADDILGLQAAARDIFVEESVLAYLLRIVAATRTESHFRSGVSTRASLSLRLAAQAAALVAGRAYVVPEDIERLVLPVLGHRLGLRHPPADAIAERRQIEEHLQRIVDAVEAPA